MSARSPHKTDPFKSVYYVLFFSLISFIAMPLLFVVFYGIFPLSSGEVLAESLIRALPFLKRSLLLAALTTPFSLLIGLSAAFTVHRFSFLLNGIFKYILLISMIHPPFVGSISFIMLFGKRGLITHDLFHLDVSPYGWQGVALMQVLGLSSLVYIILSSAIDKADTTVEDATRNLGASELTIFRDITLKRMIPELSSAAILVFLASMADFGTPLIIGGAFQTLASNLYIQITGLYDLKSASFSGILLLLPCIALFFLYRKISRSRSYFTLGLNGRDIRYRYSSPFLKYFFFSITAFYCLFVFLKYGFILVGAFTAHWGYDYSFTLDHLTKVFHKDLSPFFNSVKLAFFTALISSLAGVFLSYLIKRRRYRLRSLSDMLATIPIAVPGILLGIAYLVSFKYPFLGVGKYILRDCRPLVLLGTGVIIYIICIFRYLNVGMRIGYALIEHINPNIEDAARNLGQKEIRIYTDIVFPLIAPAFRYSFLKIFSTTMTTLGAIIFLILPSNKVAVQSIFQTITSSERGVAASMAVLLSLTILMMLGVFRGISMLMGKMLK